MDERELFLNFKFHLLKGILFFFNSSRQELLISMRNLISISTGIFLYILHIQYHGQPFLKVILQTPRCIFFLYIYVYWVAVYYGDIGLVSLKLLGFWTAQ